MQMNGWKRVVSLSIISDKVEPDSDGITDEIPLKPDLFFICFLLWNFEFLTCLLSNKTSDRNSLLCCANSFTFSSWMPATSVLSISAPPRGNMWDAGCRTGCIQSDILSYLHSFDSFSLGLISWHTNTTVMLLCVACQREPLTRVTYKWDNELLSFGGNYCGTDFLILPWSVCQHFWYTVFSSI